MAFLKHTVAINEVLAGRYRVKELLGEGAMGEVFVVEHTGTQHRRALKRLHADMARRPEVLARFTNEASAAGRIGNLHIVDTIDAGQLDDGSPYLVMELLEGRSLEALLEERLTLNVATSVEIVAQAAAGLHAAHEKGIIHRDVKPANLFIVDGEIPFVKILDFGVSRFGADQVQEFRMTKLGDQIGTPFYFAPEQARGQQDVDRRIDIYALGLVLYECLAGTMPYQALSYRDLMDKIEQGQRVPLRTAQPQLPEALVDVVERAMALDRELRYQTAEQLELALRALPIEGVYPTDPFLAVRPSIAPYRSLPPAPQEVGARVTLASDAPPARIQASSALASTTHSPVSHRTASGSQAPASTKSFAWLIAGGLLVLAGVATAGLLLSRSGSEPPPDAPVARPSATTPEPVTHTDMDLTVVPVPSAAALPGPRALSRVAPVSTARKAAVAPSGSVPVVPPMPSTAPNAYRAPSAASAKKSRAETLGLNPNNPF